MASSCISLSNSDIVLLHREKGEEVCVEKGGGLCSNGDREMTLRIRRREAGFKRGIKGENQR